MALLSQRVVHRLMVTPASCQRLVVAGCFSTAAQQQHGGVEQLLDTYISNSVLTFHPQPELFVDESFWRKHSVDNRHYRRGASPVDGRCCSSFAEINRKFQLLTQARQQLKQLQADAASFLRKRHKQQLETGQEKPDFKRQKRLKKELLETRKDLVRQWLDVPVLLEDDVALSGSPRVVDQFDPGPPIRISGDGTRQRQLPGAELLPSVGPAAVFLPPGLAQVEHRLKNEVVERLLDGDSRLVLMSCPDSLRLPVYLATLPHWPPQPAAISGCLLHQSNDPSDGDMENRFVLVGCSPQTLLGAFSKQVIKKKYLPKLVLSRGSTFFLADTVARQRSVVSILGLAHDRQQGLELFGQLAHLLTQLLQSLRLPFVGLNPAAPDLRSSEAKRLDFVYTDENETSGDNQEQQDQGQGQGGRPMTLLASLSMHSDYFTRRCEIFATVDPNRQQQQKNAGGGDFYRRNVSFPHTLSASIDTDALLMVLSRIYSASDVEKHILNKNH